MRLLVVDDDRALRDVLRRALTLAGYEVRLAETGAGALAEVTGTVPDAVVLDIGLPDIDGLEVCRLLRREGNRVPVLMLTARDAVADRIDGLDAGRRRLPGQAVRHRRAQGAAAGAAAPRRHRGGRSATGCRSASCGSIRPGTARRSTARSSS